MLVLLQNFPLLTINLLLCSLTSGWFASSWTLREYPRTQPTDVPWCVSWDGRKLWFQPFSRSLLLLDGGGLLTSVPWRGIGLKCQPHCHAFENFVTLGSLLKNPCSSQHIFKGFQKPKTETHGLSQLTSALDASVLLHKQ